MRAVVRVLAAAAVLVLVPATARAEWFVFPFAAVNTGGDTTRESGAYGASVGWSGRWLGAEGEATWSPAFFDDEGGFRTRHRATTYTATALVGPRMGKWRPYGAVGVGVLRSEIEEVGGLATLKDDRPAIHAGGGVMWLAGERFAVRGDARYIRAIDDTEAEGNVFNERLASFNYWRIGGGLTIRW